MYRDKWANEQAVKQAAAENKWAWTILRPAEFFSNLLPPMVDLQFPELRARKAFRTMLPDNTTFFWTDPDDIGKVAAHILLEGRGTSDLPSIIDLASQRSTFQDVVHAMEKVTSDISGQEVHIKIEQDDIREAAIFDDWQRKLTSVIWLIDSLAVGEVQEARVLGLELTTARGYFDKHKSEVRDVLGL